MALFTKAPETTLTRDRDTAKANAARAATQHADAVAALTLAMSDRERSALADDEAALDRAEATQRAAQDRLDSRRTKLEAANKLLTLLEGQLAVVAEEKVRSSTNKATLALADELLEAGRAYDASTALLNEVCQRALAVTMEANGLCVFTASSMIEVKVATEVVAEELRQYGRSVLNKLAPAAMPKVPVPPAKVVPKVPEPLTRVFAVKALRWRDQDSKERSCGKYVDADLPPLTAKRALAIGAAVPLHHEARKGKGSWPGNYSLSSCLDLDVVEQHDPIVHSAFQPIDRGKPFTLKIAAGGS